MTQRIQHTLGAALIAGILAATAVALTVPQPSQSQAARTTESLAAFDTVARVAMSPRCQNCHTLTNFPRQGDDRHPHLFNVTRGGADHGAPGLPCSTCHSQSNNTASGAPGAAEQWRLAPISMGWDGLSMTDLCGHLKDPQRNGHRSGDQTIDHLRSHLVMWAWSPDSDRNGRPRTLPPIPYQEFVRAAEVWVNTGSACPRG
jgi:hypothetical protein